MLSGINLVPDAYRQVPQGTSTTTNYPSIWGWYTNIESWKCLNEYLEKPPKLSKLILSAVVHPSRAFAISYFYAASIRTYKSEVEAWDCQIALAMLVHGYLAIFPSRNMVQNIGADQVSSHDMGSAQTSSRVVADFEMNTSHGEVTLSHKKLHQNNTVLKREIYKIGSRHLLSPIKASLKMGKFK
jgi:hypothetical protein